jgi:hypothetical protein
MFLVSTYSTVTDIESVRDTRLDQINGQISAAEAYITTLNTRVDGLKAAFAELRAVQRQARRAPHAR